jgi:hypothetical protein
MNNMDIYNGESRATASIAVSHLLRPLVRVLLSYGISFQSFCELAKSAYVKVAEEEFKLADKPQTDSRVSLLTGIQRREVNRIRNEPVAEIALSQNASMSALLLAIWSGNSEYLDQDGMPIPLPRLPGKDGKPSFESMVQSVSKDFRPRVVLDEWLRQGVVTLDEEDKVHLCIDTFAHPQDVEERLFYFGQNIHDHLAATAHNLTSGQPPFLERCVFYDKLSAESCQDLAEHSRTLGMIVIRAINRRAAELQKRDQGQDGAVYRSNFGVYHFSEAETSNETKAD